MPKPQICIFCASRPGSPSYTAAVETLAELLQPQHYRLLYGGGNRGLMGAIASRFSLLGGEVHGVIPRALIKREVKFPGEADIRDSHDNEKGGQENKNETTLTAAPNGVDLDGQDLDQKRMREETIGCVTVVESMHERKEYFAEKGDAFVALPGGLGTLDELVEIITWRQLAIHSKPIIILNLDGFYDNLFRLIDTFVETGFVDKETRGIVIEAKTPEEVVERLGEFFKVEKAGRELLN